MPLRPRGYWRTRLVERDAGYITPCLEWPGWKHPQGYGRIRIGGKVFYVHRIAWIETYGDPGDLLVCHHCDNPPCAREDHLYLGDTGRNTRDAAARGLMSVGARNGAARLSAADISVIRASSLPQRALAHQFHVSQRTIWNILHDKTWRHVP